MVEAGSFATIAYIYKLSIMLCTNILLEISNCAHSGKHLPSTVAMLREAAHIEQAEVARADDVHESVSDSIRQGASVGMHEWILIRRRNERWGRIAVSTEICRI